jgi:F-type H+-transporting ATPase subunit a
MANALEHVQDQVEHWHIFDRLFGGWSIPLPHFTLFGHEFYLTKYMILELLVAILIAAIYIPLARRSQNGELPKGARWNAFESLLTFIRDEVAKPSIGEHDADTFVPYLWTVFLFILFCNLLGMIPFLGSPTANIWVTGALASLSFVLIHGAPIAKGGLFHYLKSQWPHIEVGHGVIAMIVGGFLSLFVFLIEMFGTAIKCFVLAVRLFANMIAGHMVLASILLFIVIVGEGGYTNLWPVVTLSSVVGVVALSLLELFVAFLQAYVFTFLTALFVGMALHPEH